MVCYQLLWLSGTEGGEVLLVDLERRPPPGRHRCSPKRGVQRWLSDGRTEVRVLEPRSPNSLIESASNTWLLGSTFYRNIHVDRDMLFLPPENIRLKTEKMNGKIVPQREHRLQTYWFLKLTEMLTAPGEIYPRKLSVYRVGQKSLQRLPPENIRLKTDKMNGKIVPQREHRLQTYWFLKLTEMLTAPGELYPRKLSVYGVGQKVCNGYLREIYD